MGRKKLDRSIVELKDQKRIRDARYYKKHRDSILKRYMERYYKRKNNKL